MLLRLLLVSPCFSITKKDLTNSALQMNSTEAWFTFLLVHNIWRLQVWRYFWWLSNTRVHSTKIVTWNTSCILLCVLCLTVSLTTLCTLKRYFPWCTPYHIWVFHHVNCLVIMAMKRNLSCSSVCYLCVCVHSCSYLVYRQKRYPMTFCVAWTQKICCYAW